MGASAVAKGGRVRSISDLLLYATRPSRDAALTVPHPRLHERAFVLYPLSELDTTW